MPKNKLINLLPQEEFDSSLVGRVLKWAMSTFRIIVIVTEMVVMTAFLSRFWLDAQNSDLNDSIKFKSAQIADQADFEKSFRDVQTKIEIYQKLDAEQKKSDLIEKIAGRIPGDVTLSSISSGDDGFQVKGLSGSEAAIAQFIANLKDEKSFKTVDLGQISSSENDKSATLFSIKITI